MTCEKLSCSQAFCNNKGSTAGICSSVDTTYHISKDNLETSLTEISQTTDLSLVAKVIKPSIQPRHANQIPEDILYDPAQKADIQKLPSNYRFEVHKCVWQIRRHKAQQVALQFPEGLTTFACL